MGKCPKCGSNEVNSYQYTDPITPSDKWLKVECKKCGADQIADVSLHTGSSYSDELKRRWQL